MNKSRLQGKTNIAIMNCKGVKTKMSNSKSRDALNKLKVEAANEVGVNLKNGYNGDLTAQQVGSVGGQMVKRMIESYENK